MNLSKNRLAAFGAAGALAAGSVLAGGVISPAAAAEADYQCPTSTGAVLTVPIDMDNPFAASYPGGQIASVPVTMDATLDSALLGLIGLFLPPGTTSIGGTISNAVMKVGSQSVPLNDMGTAAPVPINPAGMTLPVVGETSAFTPPAGTHTVTGPKSFTFTPTGLEALALTCTATVPATLGTLLVAGDAPADEKESTTTRAKFLNTPLTTAKRPLIRVRVLQEDGDPAAGTVVVKKGKKVLKKVTLNDAGKKRFRIAKLARGEHRIVFRYKGNADSLASKVVKTVRVRRA